MRRPGGGFADTPPAGSVAERPRRATTGPNSGSYNVPAGPLGTLSGTSVKAPLSARKAEEILQPEGVAAGSVLLRKAPTRLPPDFITIYQLITGQQQDKVLSGDDQALLTEFLLRLIPPVDLEQFAVRPAYFELCGSMRGVSGSPSPSLILSVSMSFRTCSSRPFSHTREFCRSGRIGFPLPSALIQLGAELDAIPSVWTVRFNETGSWSFVAGKEEQEEADFAFLAPLPKANDKKVDVPHSLNGPAQQQTDTGK